MSDPASIQKREKFAWAHRRCAQVIVRAGGIPQVRAPGALAGAIDTTLSEARVLVIHLRREIEASHAAAALRWVSGEKAAVVTSIRPGGLQALAASLVPDSDRPGAWPLLGDEITNWPSWWRSPPRACQMEWMRITPPGCNQ